MKTRRFLIIGDPVKHSLSPAMQNAAFRVKKIPASYSKLRLTKGQLPGFFQKLRKGAYGGINVTVPHKEAVLPYLDELSEEARLIGAVNTVLVENGKLKGHNTDGAGYLESLRKEAKFQPRGKQALILGAGGAARGIVAVLCRNGVRKIILINRTLRRAQALAREFQKKFPKTRLEALSLSSKNFSAHFRKTDLLLNTTSAGLKGSPLPPLPFHRLPPHAVVSDIVYKPPLTPFLKEAKKAKRKIHGGLGMLLYQGALAFRIWTGRSAPVGVMKKALLASLRLKPAR